MFSKLLKSIQAFGDFSQEDQTLITERMINKSFKKNEFIFKQGDRCRSLYFLNSGSVRHFKDIDGYSELTINLFVEGDWVLDHHSFISQKPSENHMQAFENTELLELPMDSLHSLIGSSPSFFMLGKIMENAEPSKEEIIKTPEERYESLLENTPQIIQRFPLKHIASYLGMTPETLSRVRAKIRN